MELCGSEEADITGFGFFESISILNLMPETCFNTPKTPILDTSHVNRFIVTGDSIMNVCEWASWKDPFIHSQARMEQGSPLCETHDGIKDISTRAWTHFRNLCL